MKAFLLLMILGLGFGCKNPGSEKKFATLKVNFRDSLIIPKDVVTFSRTSEETFWIPKDTITKNNNFIKYLKTKDSCCSDNIYINWGNDSVNRIFIAQNVLQARMYFTPEIVAETNDYLILKHGCATDCSALLFLPINKNEKVHDLWGVINFDINSLSVIKELDNESDKNAHVCLEAVNIRTGKRKRLIFKHIGMAINPVYSIDSSFVSSNEIYIRANLLDDKKDKNIVEEFRTLNDIK